jgi:uncharacterized membrane protein
VPGVLAQPTDPAVIWAPRLLVVPPDRPTPSPWLPVVSFLQTSVDLLGAVGAPAGVGHHYGAEQREGWPACWPPLRGSTAWGQRTVSRHAPRPVKRGRQPSSSFARVVSMIAG